MTYEYLAGELSVQLERLQAVTSSSGAARVAQLRHRVESCPAEGLTAAVRGALALADALCWDSLSRGDIGLFNCQATISADLRFFAICSRLLADDPPVNPAGS